MGETALLYAVEVQPTADNQTTLLLPHCQGNTALYFLEMNRNNAHFSSVLNYYK
jgi:hypothetical protein